MAKFHLDHPTQSVACGKAAHYDVLGLPAVIFKTKDPDQCCKTCKKVLAAMEAGRPVYSGYEDPDAQDRGARVVPHQSSSAGASVDPRLEILSQERDASGHVRVLATTSDPTMKDRILNGSPLSPSMGLRVAPWLLALSRGEAADVPNTDRARLVGACIQWGRARRGLPNAKPWVLFGNPVEDQIVLEIALIGAAAPLPLPTLSEDVEHLSAWSAWVEEAPR